VVVVDKAVAVAVVEVLPLKEVPAVQVVVVIS
jgi:hypothetical protein